MGEMSNFLGFHILAIYIIRNFSEEVKCLPICVRQVTSSRCYWCCAKNGRYEINFKVFVNVRKGKDLSI